MHGSSHRIKRIVGYVLHGFVRVSICRYVLNTPDDGRLRPKHVEWLCRDKTCTVSHQVGVSFDLYCDARKHKIKIKWEIPIGYNFMKKERKLTPFKVKKCLTIMTHTQSVTYCSSLHFKFKHPLCLTYYVIGTSGHTAGVYNFSTDLGWHLKILNARREKWGNLHIQNTQTLGATVKHYVVAMA